MITVAVFAVAGTWLALSATRHSKAQAACLTNFFPDNSSLGTTMCNIFPWVDVGIMGGLWAFFAAIQVRCT